MFILFCILFNSLAFGQTIYVSSSVKSVRGANSRTNPMSLDDALAALTSNTVLSLLKGDVFSTFESINKKYILRRVNNVTVNSYSLPNTPNNDRKPIITQAVNVTSSPKTLYGTKVVEGTTYQIYKVDLSSIMTDANHHSIWGFWIDGVRYMLARYPNLVNPTILNGMNEREFIFVERDTTADQNNPNDWNTAISSYLVYPDRSLKTLNTSYWAGATIRTRTSNWSYQRNKIAQVNSNKTFTLNMPIVLQFKNGFFLEDKFEELDAPGEYYYNKETKQLYYVHCPPSICPSSTDTSDKGLWILPHGNSFSDSYLPGNYKYHHLLDAHFLERSNEVSSAQTSYGLSIRSTNQITIQDLCFTKSFIGLSLNASEFNVRNCSFNKMISTGVYPYYNSNGIIQYSTFEDIDFHGITSRGDGVIVDNVSMNRISLPAGYTFQGSGAAFFWEPPYQSEHPFIVRNSRFKSMGYNAIAVLGLIKDKGEDEVEGAGNSIVLNNIIEDWSMTLADVGGIYTWSADGVTIENNKIIGRNYANIVSNRWPNHGFGAGIYMDEDGNRGLMINNQITAESRYCIRLNHVFYAKVQKNTCLNAGLVISATSSNDEFIGNTINFDNSKGTMASSLYYREASSNPFTFRDNLITITRCNQNVLRSIPQFNSDFRSNTGNRVNC